MALINMKELLKVAKINKTAIGAFNVANMEMIIGAIKAAEELNTPIILQIAEGRLNYSPLELIGPMMVSAAKNSKVPIVVHLDHGNSEDIIHKALDIGFSSVMFDGSHFPIDKNIEFTKSIVKLAKKYNASVEAEIGIVGGSEIDDVNHDIKFSSIEETKRLVLETNLDAIAIAIGNSHGFYKSVPKLNFKLLSQINKIIPNTPLVLHGGTGLSDDDFKTAIKNGISKINIATATFISVFDNLKNNFNNNNIHSYFDVNNIITLSTYENVKKHILLFNSQNSFNIGGINE